MTQRLVGEVTAESELLFRSSRRRGNVLETLAFVPGSTVRGALAHRWIDSGRPVDDAFRGLFQDGRVRWTHGRPVVDGEPAYPAPLTLRTDKQRPFEPGTVFDALLGDGDDQRPRSERVKGDVTLGGRIRRAGQPLSLRTRIGTFEDDGSGAEPARAGGAQGGLAAEGQLFTEVTLPVGTSFRLEVSGPDELLEQLQPLLAPDEDLLRIGRSRTLHGHASVRWSSTSIAEADLADGEVHTLTALSDLVLLDRYQRAVTVLDQEALAGVLRVDAADVTVERAFQRTTEVGAWDGLNSMPGPFDTAIRAGSCVAFRTETEEAAAALARLASSGFVGWRNTEGHGQVAVDLALHGPGATFSVVDDEPTEHPPGAGLDERAHRVASDLRNELGRDLTPSLWSQVESAVRTGRGLSLPDLDDEVRGSQQSSGRGAGSGSDRRSARRALVKRLQAAFAEDAELNEGDRVALVEQVGREIRLQTLDADDRRRRRIEAGGVRAAERMER